MSIQGSINNMIQSAATLAVLNPNIRAKAEDRQKQSEANRMLKKLDDEIYKGKEASQAALEKKVTAGATPEEFIDQVEHEMGYFEDVAKKAAAAYKEKYKINPSRANYEALQAKKSAAQLFKDLPGKLRQELANDKASVKNEAQASQRRRFLDYIKNEPTNLGVTIGQLDPKMQKEIAKSYSKGERRRIMDKEDKAHG